MGLLNRFGQLAVAKVRQRTRSVRAQRSTTHGSGIVLTYGGISTEQLHRFRDQMEWLATHAIVQPLSALADAPEAMSEKPRVAIAFDGAFDSVHRNAIPNLDKLRLPATVFAVSDYLGRAPGWDMPSKACEKHEIVMTVGQLSSLRRDLFEVGSLTATHAHLDKLSPEQIRAELLNSMNDLSAALARPIRLLGIPYGVCHAATIAVAHEVGYQILVARSTKGASSGSAPIIVSSVPVHPDDWISEFELKVQGRYGWRKRRTTNGFVPDAEKAVATPSR